MEEGEVDIAGHAECPKSVRGHEPEENQMSEKKYIRRICLPLNQKSLELAYRGPNTCVDSILGNEGGYIGHYITPRGVEGKSVDWFSKRSRADESDHDDKGSSQRDCGANTLCDRYGP